MKIKLTKKQWFHILWFATLGAITIAIPTGGIGVFIASFEDAYISLIGMIIFTIVMFILFFKYKVLDRYLNWLAKVTKIKERMDNENRTN